MSWIFSLALSRFIALFSLSCQNIRLAHVHTNSYIRETPDGRQECVWFIGLAFETNKQTDGSAAHAPLDINLTEDVSQFVAMGKKRREF